MHYRLSAEPGYFLAELYDRRTAEETMRFLHAAHRGVVDARADRILLFVHDSRALFKVEEYRLASMIDVAVDLGLRVALASDSIDVYLSHQYVEMLARQRGLDLRAFRNRHRALEWLLPAPAAAQVPTQPALPHKH